MKYTYCALFIKDATGLGSDFALTRSHVLRLLEYVAFIGSAAITVIILLHFDANHLDYFE